MKKKGTSGQVPDYETEDDVMKAAEIQSMSPIDPRLELLDPNPNIHSLFAIFDNQFFWGRLKAVEVKWSPRMTTCAGICRYQTRSGFCTIGLSKPLLALRPRKDLVETLLHEMIHAYLFVTHNNRDRDGHGPEFHKHMYRINNNTGAAISVYHTFHDEVRAQKVHVWRCEGPCKDRPPFFGYVRRSMNRAPGPHDLWHIQHLQSCGGTFVKILEPPNFKSKKKGEKKITVDSVVKATPKITDMFKKSPIKTSPFTSQLPVSFKAFSGTGFKLGGSTATSKVLAPVSKIPNSQSEKPRKPNKLQTPSPIKISPTKITTKDISSYFIKSPSSSLNMSDDVSDSELLILSPPKNKRKLVSTPNSNSNPNKKPKLFGDERLSCPICSKKGFADINIHANLCLNTQSESPNDKTSELSKSTKTLVLDDSIEEIPTSSNKGLLTSYLSRTCSICGKVIPHTVAMSEHVLLCIASIPGDDDDLLIKHDKNGKQKVAEPIAVSDVSHNNIPSPRHNNEMPTSNKTSTSNMTNILPTSNEPLTSNKTSIKTVPGPSKDLTVITIDDPGMVSCPICNIHIKQIEINTHLDLCLTSGFS